MVLVMARQEAGLCEWRQNSRAMFSSLRQKDTQTRVGKQLWAARKTYQNEQGNSSKKGQLTISYGIDEAGVVLDEDDD